MPKIIPADLPVRTGSGYPMPFSLACQHREKRALGDAAELTQFGVNLTRLPPGEWSAQRHWHSTEDELVYVLEGELVLITDAGEERLGPGDCAAFKAGVEDGHHLINRGDADAVYLEIGGRVEADVCTYPDVDLHLTADGFARKNGTRHDRSLRGAGGAGTRAPMRILILPVALLIATNVHAAPTPADVRIAEHMRDRALAGSGAFQIVESLTTEVGQRLAGSPAEARARNWAVAKMKALGFQNVHVEPFTIQGWVRGAETAEITSPVPQKLAITALGNSGATPPGGIDGEIAGFTSMDAFREATPAQVRGKIVFITHRMAATQDGSSYGAFNAVRTRAPALASKLGAAAIVIRSLATDNRRLPHTGVTIWKSGGPRPPGGRAQDGVDAAPIPAAAMSVPDSELIERLLAMGKPVRLHLLLTPRFTGASPSGNVVGEIVGSERPDEIVLIGGHLDSWDLGQGAIDDGTGIAVSFAAAKLVADQGRPRRTVRLVAWGSEETGLDGGTAYAKAHGGDKHILAAEDDSGGARAWKLDTRVADAALPAVTAMARVVLPLGIPFGGNDGGYESDLGPLAAFGVPVLDFAQDASGYFALHHTADDTLDKVDAKALDQTTAAYAAMVWMAANGTDIFGPAKPESAR